MLFGDLQAHKIKLKLEFLGFAVMSQQFDMTAKPKKIIFQLYFVSLRVPKSQKLLPPTSIKIEFWMKYQIFGFLTGTQILTSSRPLQNSCFQ